ncbi:hypothetical protein ISS03_02415 [Patescibacteria group bacterium]|nr:hypothetical protein [Patescibacteria group bacterium]
MTNYQSSHTMSEVKKIITDAYSWLLASDVKSFNYDLSYPRLIEMCNKFKVFKAQISLAFELYNYMLHSKDSVSESEQPSIDIAQDTMSMQINLLKKNADWLADYVVDTLSSIAFHEVSAGLCTGMQSVIVGTYSEIEKQIKIIIN